MNTKHQCLTLLRNNVNDDRRMLIDLEMAGTSDGYLGVWHKLELHFGGTKKNTVRKE